MMPPAHREVAGVLHLVDPDVAQFDQIADQRLEVDAGPGRDGQRRPAAATTPSMRVVASTTRTGTIPVGAGHRRPGSAGVQRATAPGPAARPPAASPRLPTRTTPPEAAGRPPAGPGSREPARAPVQPPLPGWERRPGRRDSLQGWRCSRPAMRKGCTKLGAATPAERGAVSARYGLLERPAGARSQIAQTGDSRAGSRSGGACGVTPRGQPLLREVGCRADQKEHLLPRLAERLQHVVDQRPVRDRGTAHAHPQPPEVAAAQGLLDAAQAVVPAQTPPSLRRTSPKGSSTSSCMTSMLLDRDLVPARGLGHRLCPTGS